MARKVDKKASERAKRAIAARKGPITIKARRPMRLTGRAGEAFVEAQFLALGWDVYRPSDKQQAPVDLIAVKGDRTVRIEVKAISTDGATGWGFRKPLEKAVLYALLLIDHDASWPTSWVAWGHELSPIARVSDARPGPYLTRLDLRNREEFKEAWTKIKSKAR